MPKSNLKGGKKHKKNKKAGFESHDKNMVYKENKGEEYALVTDLVGNGNVRIKLPNGSIMISRIPGSFKKKKKFINKGNILLIAIREYEEAKSDIIYKYSDGQARILQKNNLLPPSFLSFSSIHQPDDVIDNDIIFTNDEPDNVKTGKPIPIDRSKRMGELDNTIPNEADYQFSLEEI
jgi:translation initiation factor 1A